MARSPVEDPSLVLVPGVGDSGDAHWQTWLQRSHAGATRVVQDDWNLPVRDEWVAALERHLAGAGGRVLLAAHSAGAVTVVHWAARTTPALAARVAGALLVAPADLERELPDGTPVEMLEDLGWVPCPRRPLPFPSIVVASSNDPYADPVHSRGLAANWGSRFVLLEGAGHINADAGFGPWPLAVELLGELAGRA